MSIENKNLMITELNLLHKAGKHYKGDGWEWREYLSYYRHFLKDPLRWDICYGDYQAPNIDEFLNDFGGSEAEINLIKFLRDGGFIPDK